MERCGECGFVYDDVAVEAIPGRLRALPARYRERLAAGAAAVRARPLPGVWSALEYACHVRDVLDVQRQRLLLALTEERPVFESMGREERVVDDRYNEQDPQVVVDQMEERAEALAAALERLDAREWDHTGVYNWPTTAERDMRWLARHTLHEGVHHLMDAERVLAGAGS